MKRINAWLQYVLNLHQPPNFRLSEIAGNMVCSLPRTEPDPALNAEAVWR